MLGRRLAVGVAVVALALGAGLGTGAAAAATATAAPATISQSVLVLSDTITFSGVAVPNAVAEGFVLNSNNCTLISDGENVVFPCTIKLTFSLATLTGTGHTVSADGVTNWSFKLVPGAVVGTYAVVGTCAVGAALCYEIDSDGPVSVMYPIATVTGTITIKPIVGTPNLQVTGKVSIWEDSTAP